MGCTRSRHTTLSCHAEPPPFCPAAPALCIGVRPRPDAGCRGVLHCPALCKKTFLGIKVHVTISGMPYIEPYHITALAMRGWCNDHPCARSRPFPPAEHTQKHGAALGAIAQLGNTACSGRTRNTIRAVLQLHTAEQTAQGDGDMYRCTHT